MRTPALLLAALALAPAAPASARPAPAVVSFTGTVTLGCLNCSGAGGIDATATVVQGTTAFRTRLVATVSEDTTPDPCPVLLQAFGYFSMGPISGQISWLRTLNGIAITVSDVSGSGFNGSGTGAGAAAVVANPVDLALEGCGSENVTYGVTGTLTLA